MPAYTETQVVLIYFEQIGREFSTESLDENLVVTVVIS